jgi:hypothetical protein
VAFRRGRNATAGVPYRGMRRAGRSKIGKLNFHTFFLFLLLRVFA